ncbi:KGG domain-containing protein [Antrihabitans sp. YC2-6]|uniref:KGG domain-containing protein n=1 Tax=Antrihabitans sp. YC2-6 TaxID=2799498 RepID=UPI0035A901AF
MGGAKGTTGGFAANPELARIAGAKGGKKSRRRRANETDSQYADRLAAHRTKGTTQPRFEW